GVKIDLTNQIARSPFYIPYAGLDDREVLKEIALLHQPPPDPPLRGVADRASHDRVRIGFISSFFKDHTVGLWTQGIIATLPPDRQANYAEKLVALKNLPLYYYRPPSAPPRRREDFGLPAAARVYGCLHSTFKLHPEFDAVIGGILRADPAGLLLIPRTGSSN